MGKNNYIGIVFLMISISYAIKLGSKGLSLAMTEEEIAIVVTLGYKNSVEEVIETIQQRMVNNA